MDPFDLAPAFREPAGTVIEARKALVSLSVTIGRPAGGRPVPGAEDFWHYHCPRCGGTALDGNPETGARYRGSARCRDCGDAFAAVRRKDLLFYAGAGHECAECGRESGDSVGGGCCPWCGGRRRPKGGGKGDYHLHGLTWAVEYPRGSERKGRKVTLHYGHIRGTKGKDGAGVDFWMDPEGLDLELFFVVNQMTKDGLAFDEAKCMIGFKNEEAARRGYLDNYPRDLGPKLLGGIVPMTLPQFKKWVEEDGGRKGSLKEGAARQATADPLARLLEAKARSDAGDMEGKAAILRALIQGAPDQWLVDSPDGKYPGLTHVPTGFRIHAPRGVAALVPAPAAPAAKAAADGEDEPPFTVAVDLDGTLAENLESFDPEVIGKPRKNARKAMTAFREAGALTIVFTVRGDTARVRKWLEEHEIPFDHINENPYQPPGSSGKVIADVYWDDRGVNARDDDSWEKVLALIEGGGED